MKRTQTSLCILILLRLLTQSTIGRAQTVDVWIDPGHGAGDSGSPGISGNPAKYEKNLALAVSNVLHSRLGQLGFSSFQTRNSDVFFELDERAEMASGLRQNDLGEQGVGQMVVCVHMNANKDTTIIGSETYYPRTKPYFKKLDAYRVDSTYARAVHTNMMSQAPLAFFGCNSNRGVKKAGFRVIKNARVPGVYIEVCFVSNRCQQDAIAVQGNQALIANGIAAGIGQVISPGGFAHHRPPTDGFAYGNSSNIDVGVENSRNSTSNPHAARSAVQLPFSTAVPPAGACVRWLGVEGKVVVLTGWAVGKRDHVQGRKAIVFLFVRQPVRRSRCPAERLRVSEGV